MLREARKEEHKRVRNEGEEEAPMDAVPGRDVLHRFAARSPCDALHNMYLTKSEIMERSPLSRFDEDAVRNNVWTASVRKQTATPQGRSDQDGFPLERDDLRKNQA